MNRKNMFFLVMAVLVVTFPNTARSGFVYQFAGLPAGPVTPGTSVSVEVRLAEFDTTVLNNGIFTAAVQIAPEPGLVLDSITTGSEWIGHVDLETGTWDGFTNTQVTAGPVLLATYGFIVNQTTSFSAVDPQILGIGSVGDLAFNVYPIESANGTFSVVPEPATLFGWSTALAVVAGVGWVRTRRHRRARSDV